MAELERAYVITEKEKEIIECFAREWDEHGGNRLYGGISYKEVFNLLDKLEISRPPKLTAWIEEMETKHG